MDQYESLGTIGEGTYGVVLKCRHKDTGRIVAIKRFKESDDDEQVRKTALREIQILKKLRHENVVNLLEVFRRKGKLYLVFEFVERTVLEELESNPEGIEPKRVKFIMYQLLRAIHFCHKHNIIHRDIKPENLLISKNGVLKLCDFGFARSMATAGAKYTDYVSTRWYRAPELLVGDVSYGKGVDIWAIGCMMAEISNGLPLFPGDSDIDQLYHIIKTIGAITPRQKELFRNNPLYVGVQLPHADELETLQEKLPHFNKVEIDFIRQTLCDEPLDRLTCKELLDHPYFSDEAEHFEKQISEASKRDVHEQEMKLRKAKRSLKSRTGSNNDSIIRTNSIGTTSISRHSVDLDTVSAFSTHLRLSSYKSPSPSFHDEKRKLESPISQSPLHDLVIDPSDASSFQDTFDTNPAFKRAYPRQDKVQIPNFSQVDESNYLPNLRSSTPKMMETIDNGLNTVPSSFQNNGHNNFERSKIPKHSSGIPVINKKSRAGRFNEPLQKSKKTNDRKKTKSPHPFFTNSLENNSPSDVSNNGKGWRLYGQGTGANNSPSKSNGRRVLNTSQGIRASKSKGYQVYQHKNSGLANELPSNYPTQIPISEYSTMRNGLTSHQGPRPAGMYTSSIKAKSKTFNGFGLDGLSKAKNRSRKSKRRGNAY